VHVRESLGGQLIGGHEGGLIIMASQLVDGQHHTAPVEDIHTSFFWVQAPIQSTTCLKPSFSYFSIFNDIHLLCDNFSERHS